MRADQAVKRVHRLVGAATMVRWPQEAPVSVGLAVFSILLGIGILAMGLRLVRSGRQRRIGHDPRCPRCDYNLTASRLQQCPECGLDLVNVPLPRGRRARSPVTTIGGAGLLLSGLGLTLYGIWAGYERSGISLYQLRPDVIVTADLGDDPLHAHAAEVLHQRLAAGGLSSRSIDAALDGTVQRLQAGRHGRGIIFLDVLNLANALLRHPQVDRTQKCQILSGLHQFRCSYEPGTGKIEIGGASDLRAPEDRARFVARYRLDPLTVDGQSVPQQAPIEAFLVYRNLGGGLDWGSAPQPLRVQPRQQVRLRLVIEWYDLQQTEAAAAALDTLPLRRLQPVMDDRAVHLLRQWIDRFQLKPVGSVQANLTLSPTTGWSAVADSTNWKLVPP